MTEDLKSKMGTTLDPLSGARNAGMDRKPQNPISTDDFPGDFEKLKLSVIRPVFESVGTGLKELGNEVNIAEEPGGKISIHIVPAGVSKSIHPYNWFPTLSFYGAPFTKTIGLHGTHARRNSDGGTGERGVYQLSQVNKGFVEKELNKFVGEIANWK